jgi:hypothetical protein
MVPHKTERGALFIKSLIISGVFWFVSSWILLKVSQTTGVTSAFYKSFLISTLDLVVLITLMWKVIFSQRSGLARKIDLLFWFVFKLVCWWFLAITLKRLTNATGLELFLGVGFVGFGPVVAGWWAQRQDTAETTSENYAKHDTSSR